MDTAIIMKEKHVESETLRMKKPGMMFFDLGDTIITSMNREPFHYEAGFNAVLETAAANPGNVLASQLVDEYFSCEKDKRIETRQGMLDLTMEIPFSTTLRYLLEMHQVSLSISFMDAAELFWRHRTRYALCDGVQDFLRFLKGQGIRTAMITNNLFQDSIVQKRLDELLPEKPMEFIISSADYAFCKPKPQLFQIALQRAGVSAQDAWHVGDSITCDVQGAGAVGIYPVWYKRYYTGHHKPAENLNYLRANNWQDIVEAIG